MRRTWWATIGPGLVWAGTAVGVSHLVQSTRAGASYGLGLLGVVVLANLLKMPAYSAGPLYAALTGRSLLEGYRRRGRWAVWSFVGLTICTMFTVVAAVTFVAAGMASSLVAEALPLSAWVALLSCFAVVLLWTGGFRGLERFMTAMMLLLSVATVASVVLLGFSVQVPSWGVAPRSVPLERADILFIVALVGWMPSALDTAAWHSMWSLESTPAPTLEGARTDFLVGYLGTTALAVLFVVLGAGVLQGVDLPDGSAAFATLLVDSYAGVLGAWARPVLLVAALATMLSTTVAVTDGFPRALEGAIRRLNGPEVGPEPTGPLYRALLLVVVAGSFGICLLFLGQLRALVDLATALTGLTAPGFAVLNLLALRGEEVPEAHRPGGLLLVAHIGGIVFLLGMAALYLVVVLQPVLM